MSNSKSLQEKLDAFTADLSNSNTYFERLRELELEIANFQEVAARPRFTLDAETPMTKQYWLNLRPRFVRYHPPIDAVQEISNEWGEISP